MLNGSSLIWIAEEVLRDIIEAADDAYPQETGGVFMGYRSIAPCATVITESLGPGPNARHENAAFQPDYEFQEAEIARHYERCGRRETYLGDWHSHPGATTGRLSFKDRVTLRRIAVHEGSRIRTPIMGVVFGRREDRKMAIWRYRRNLFSPFFPSVSAIRLRTYPK